MNSSSLKAAKGNRFERRKQRTRDDLVVAATRVLANKGLQATKIADIAAAADVGVGTFYLHFETKDALYDALVEDAAQRLKATVDAAREGSTIPSAETRAATAAMCRFARDNREVFKLVFGPAVSHHDVVRRAQAEFARDIEQTIRVASNAASSVPYRRRSPRRRWSACRRSSSRGGASTKRYRSSG